MKQFALGALLLLAGFAEASDETSLDSVVVTGSRISYQDLSETPAIGIIKPADSIAQHFSLDCDTRDEGPRRSEIHQMLKKIVDATNGKFDVETHDGLKLDSTNFRVDLDLGGKPDTSRGQFQLRANLKDRANKASDLVEDMRSFLSGIDKVGRTQLTLESGTSLTVSKPERFRYELLAAIAADVAQVHSSFGQSCKVSLSNLGARIEWERASTGELLLFIPYEMSLSGCAVGSR